MSVSAGLLDFFVLEATEYTDRLRALLTARGSAVPEMEAFGLTARALRGTATMARLDAFADLAGAVEKIARDVREGRIAWNPTLHAETAAAVDELRQLISGVREWTPEHESRARHSAATLRSAPPGSARKTPSTPANAMPALGARPHFLAGELEAIAASVDPHVVASSRATSLAEAGARARALRGLAGLEKLPPLPDVIDAVERASASPPGQASSSLLSAAARLLAHAAAELRAGRRPVPTSAEADEFGSALAASQPARDASDRIVPIESLFFTDDGPHVVKRSPTAPASPRDRLRNELVVHAEHLRRLLDEQSRAVDPVTRGRVSQDLRSALRSLGSTGASFGSPELSKISAELDAETDLFDPIIIATLDSVASLLATSAIDADEMARRLNELTRGRVVDRALGLGLAVLTAAAAPETRPEPRPEPTPKPEAAPAVVAEVTRVRQGTPTGRGLHALLATGITTLMELENEPLSDPVSLDELSIVPIGDLLYRGRAALDRAIEVRDEIRASGTTTEESLGELFDLLDLATAE